MSASERIIVGGQEIDLSVRRTSRRKTIALSFGADGLKVLAPAELSDREVRAFIDRKREWVLKKHAGFEEVGGLHPPREFVSGEAFSYLGRTYRLHIYSADDASHRGAALRGGFFKVPVRPNERGDGEALAVRRRLRAWYEKHAKAKLIERTGLYCDRLGLKMPSVRIANQQKRWGSCDKEGTLRFNWRIVMAPIALVDYVVAHELCHIIEHNHSSRFWRLLETTYPDMNAARERLRREGHRYYF